MRFLYLTCVALLGGMAAVQAQTDPAGSPAALQVEPGFRLHPGTTTQTEVFIEVDPGNPNVMFSSANAIRFQPSLFISEGIYATTDGGSSWFGSDTCTGEPIQFHGGDPGIAIDRNGNFILVRLGLTPFSGLYSHFSTDRGLTWSNQNTLTTDDLERAAVATDWDPASPFYGRTYAIWVRFGASYPTFFSRTDDGGATWSAPARINNPTQRSAGGDIAVGRNGKVHVCWAVVMSVSPLSEIFVGFSFSTDGGATWATQENAFAMLGIQGILTGKQSIRVNGQPRIAVDNSGGPRDGWVYIVTAQKNRAPAGSDPDIILNRSTDGGLTWSAGIRVNRDALNNGKVQYFPAVTVDDAGGLNILYYDDRTTTSDSTGVFLSRSLDGGDTWTEVEISDHHFRPVPIAGLAQGYQGDNIDMAFTNNTLWPVWMDNSTGIYQVWTAPVHLPLVGIDGREENPAPAQFTLLPNFPNPFNPSTTIEYQLQRGGWVTLKVFDSRGSEVAELVNEQQAAGVHRVKFDGKSGSLRSLPSGIYYYRLTALGIAQTRAMHLIR